MMRRHLFLLALAAGLVAACSSSDSDECKAHEELCDGSCVDTSTSAAHCGACGEACDDGLVCHEGSCVCPAGMSVCDGECVDLDSDPRHCGGCGASCVGSLECIDGACGSDGGCTGIRCGENRTCVDPMNDAQNCGGCGIACEEGQRCLSGVCAVGDLFVACGSGPVVPFSKTTLEVSSPVYEEATRPVSLALYGDDYLLVLDGGERELHVVSRQEMSQVGVLEIGNEPTRVLVREERAYVLDTGADEIHVIDLSKPSSPMLLYSHALQKENPGQRFRPFDGVFDERTLWVSLPGADGLVLVMMGALGGTEAPYHRSIPTDMTDGKPAPAGITRIGNTFFAALGNLDYATGTPVGNGRLYSYPWAGQAEAIDLGPDCYDPREVRTDGTDVFISCRGSGGADGAIVAYRPGAPVEEALTVHAIGGRLEALAVDPSRSGWVYTGDLRGSEIASISPQGEVKWSLACAPIDGESVTAIVAAP